MYQKWEKNILYGQLGYAIILDVGAHMLRKEKIMKKKFCIISHTHWDREWYMPFEMFRILLANLINKLFEIIEKYPEYTFHLDAQTIVLEDYLEIYPENRDKLEKYISSGNIIVGPWYVQNDFFLTCGEATVRNLIVGKKIANSFGKCGNIGYTPDQFGLPGQLPQIFEQFGIKYHLFARGYRFYNEDGEQIPSQCEAYWVAPNGSKVFSMLMPFWYNNAQRINSDPEKTKINFEKAEKDFEAWTKSDYLLMMNGVDHLAPQDDLFPSIDAINSLYKEKRVFQMSMEDYMEIAVRYTNNYKRYGELRNGNNLDILGGTFSTRTDIKKQNYDAQNMILYKIEPLYSIMGLYGFKNKYPKNLINYMWKLLMQNHPHDSICCCSCNNVMKHMNDRFLSLNEIGEKLLEDGCKYFSAHITREKKYNAKYYFTVINTSQNVFSGVMTVMFDFPIWDNNDFVILSEDGENIPYEIIEESEESKGSYSELNLPGYTRVIRKKINVLIKNIPSFGYTNFLISDGEKKQIKREYDFLENEYIKLNFKEGKFDLVDKIKNCVYEDIIIFDDWGDRGNSYVTQLLQNHYTAVFDSMEIIENSSLISRLLVKYKIIVPSHISAEGIVEGEITDYINLTVSLKRGSKHIDFDVAIDNQGKNHLMRVGIKTDVFSDISYASSIYDVIKRDRTKIKTDIINPTEPVNGFVFKKSDNKGIAIYTKGLYEYEDSKDGRIYLSLLRSTGLISSPNSDKRFWASEDNFMMGSVNLSFAIMPIDDETKIHSLEHEVNYEPLYWFDSVDTLLFEGGNADVQTTDVKELYFFEDEYSYINLPHKGNLININPNMCVTAFKCTENDSGYVIRMYNPYENNIENVITTQNMVVKTNMDENSEKEFNNIAEKKEIISLKINNCETII